jgi:diguanylate cyclase (GGDEF)-like protein
MMNKKTITILLIEDNPGDARLLREMLNESATHKYDLTHLGSMEKAVKYLATVSVDLVLLDLGLPDASGLGAVRQARAVASDIPIVVLTGLDDEFLAAQALQEGAQDYLVKGQIQPNGLLRSLRYAIERQRLQAEADHVRKAQLQLKDDFSSQLLHSVQHDSLTSLPNRSLIHDRISQAIALARRHGTKFAVLFLDLDGFKYINDSLGHSIGDTLLQSIGKRLAACVRTSDTVSRHGGDEFVVLLSEIANSQDAAILAKRMLNSIAEAHCVSRHELHITASIGVSVYPDDGLDAETLVKNADTAMYQAKENGRHGYQFFKASMNVRAVERQSIEEGLRRAVERREFALHYQPIINIRTGEITGAEALIRWTHPVRGHVSPAQFIPIAEDCGLILPIGNWVLHEACKQARAWIGAGLPVRKIAVNISAMEFRNDRFLENVFAILKETALDPSALELELTESVLIKRAESAASVLQKLRASGIQIAVDDFGTGYSSLSYLSKFPIDALKIDQSFIRQITATPGDTSIVTAVISMGRSLKLRVVAEGVETLDELEFLKAHQCESAQGYYFSRPVPAPQFARLLETGIREVVAQ